MEDKCKAINLAIKAIKQRSRNLSPKQIATLCGQAKAGDPAASIRGLQKILREKGLKYERNNFSKPICD